MSNPSGGPNPAQVYQEHLVPAMFAPWAQELLSRVSPQHRDQVLDVACGTGAVTHEIARIVGSEGAVVGLDISPPMLQVAASLPVPDGANIVWREGPADALPFPDDQFDMVTCQHGIQFVPNRSAAASEMHRGLRLGGRVGISVWRGMEEQGAMSVIVEAMDREFGVTANDPFSMGDPAELQSLLEQAGFSDITVEDVRREVTFPSLEQFVRLTILGAAAVIPELSAASDAEREAAVVAIREQIDDQLRTMQVGSGIVFEMAANIAVATKR